MQAASLRAEAIEPRYNHDARGPRGSTTPKAPLLVALAGRDQEPLRGRRAWHAGKIVRQTWEILGVLPGRGVRADKGNTEEAGMARRKSEGPQ